MRHEGGSPLLCFVEVVMPPHSPLPPLQWRGEKTAAWEEGGEGGLVEKQWGCNRIPRVWIVLGLVMAVDWSNPWQSRPPILCPHVWAEIHLYSAFEFPPVKVDHLGLKNTFGMACQEGMLNTTLQYHGSKLLQSQWPALCIDWLPLEKWETAYISLNRPPTHICLYQSMIVAIWYFADKRHNFIEEMQHCNSRRNIVAASKIHHMVFASFLSSTFPQRKSTSNTTFT